MFLKVNKYSRLIEERRLLLATFVSLSADDAATEYWERKI